MLRVFVTCLCVTPGFLYHVMVPYFCILRVGLFCLFKELHYYRLYTFHYFMSLPSNASKLRFVVPDLWLLRVRLYCLFFDMNYDRFYIFYDFMS